MQETTIKDTCPQFFAAANGYDGFRSYFTEIFDSAVFERIFVLKGGPGTGKSSLMKKVAEFGMKNEYSAEKILCSSDPHSLDGVILEKNNKRFAVLDGTAPHTRDADIPGSCDEIINLGENWNDTALIKNRSLILELNKRKKKNYAEAYRHLACLGKVKDAEASIIYPLIKWKSLKSSAKTEAERIFKNEQVGKSKTKLISSFGRFGLFRVNTLENFAKEKITVRDIGLVSREYMRALYEELFSLGCYMTVFPDVFDKNRTEAIFLNASERAVIMSSSDKCSIDPSEFLISNPNMSSHKDFEGLSKSLSDEAQKFFGFASDLHFELEKIYIAAMNFSANDTFLDKITEKIKIFSL